MCLAHCLDLYRRFALGKSPMKRIGIILVVAALLGWPLFVSGQVPDSRGEIAIDQPRYRGVEAAAPIPVELHVHNEGGSDGAGLCVISSVLSAGMTQGVPGLETPGPDEASGTNKPGKGSMLWMTAKARRGGYSPDKLAQILNETNPGEKWVSYSGVDIGEVEKLIKAGYRVCATMTTGQQYGYQRINHMINVVHYETNGYACVVDNNDPGKFHWMPAQEYARRWVDGRTGWAFAWLRRASTKTHATVFFFLAAATVTVAAALRIHPQPRGNV
jgi:hypothetical protein